MLNERDLEKHGLLQGWTLKKNMDQKTTDSQGTDNKGEIDPCTQVNSINVSDSNNNLNNTNSRLNPREAFNNYKEAADNLEKTKMSKQIHRFGGNQAS